MKLHLFKLKKGMVLLLCLIFLTALTLLGLSASADAILQHQLAANLQDTERATQSAQTALRWAEQWLLDLEGPPPASCSGTCEGFTVHPVGTLPPHPEFESLSWWLTHGFEAGIDPQTGERLENFGAGNFSSPTWVIEFIHEIAAPEDGSSTRKVWYRLLARGSGHSEPAVSVVESIVTRSWSTSEDTNQQPAGGRESWQRLR
jgi:Tfp pilus assembly protein PilX